MSVAISVIIIALIISASLYLYKANIPNKEGPIKEPIINAQIKRRRLPRYKGPKTDERINRMLSECIELLTGLGVPISQSVAPDVVLTSAHSYWGMCCPKGSRKKYTEYNYYIEISGFTVNNSERNLRNTLLHELIHTIPGGLTHKGAWKKWADYVSEKTGYHIQHYGGEMTEQDEKNLRQGC